MGQIDFTNLVIDDFRKGKWNPFSKYIYILTHIHSDHLTGLNNSWNYGPIYCSQITANLILNKFNGLKNLIHVVPLQQQYVIKLSEQLSATITFFDANHCPGAVIALLEGYFGRFLYTGDFRFRKDIFERYTYLYPPQMKNDCFEKCSKHIDKMWLDNTFCNPRFNFPNREDSFKLVIEFVRENLGKRIFVGMDNYGKEEALIHIAETFDTIIVVNEQRYETVIAMGHDRQYFTTNPEEGLIQVVTKKRFREKLEENQQSLGLIMSGWCNTPYWSKDNRIYHVPYSLHSNYNQIVAFVKSIYPSMIEPVVPLDQHSSIQQNSINLDQRERYSTEGNANAFRTLAKNYTSPISQLYLKNQNDKPFLQALKQKLGLDKKTISDNQMKAAQVTYAKNIPPKGKGYKIDNQRDEQQIQRLKKMLKQRGKMERWELKQLILSQDQQEPEIIQIKDKPKTPAVIQIKDTINNPQIIPKKKKKKQLTLKTQPKTINMNDFKDMKIVTGKDQYLGLYYLKMKEYLTALHQGKDNC